MPVIKQTLKKLGRVGQDLEPDFVVKKTLEAARGLLPSDVYPVRKCDPKYAVIVIGAGLAGLAAAYELHHLGYDVTVLEARSRPGGRVLSIRNPSYLSGQVVEGGAELIGSNHAAWHSYRRKFRLGLRRANTQGDSILSLFGLPIKGQRAATLEREMQKAYDSLNRLAARVPPKTPWRAPRAQELDSMSYAEWVGKQEMKPLCESALLQESFIDNGVSPRHQSLLGMLAMIKGGGLQNYWDRTEDWRCKRGNDRLAAALARPLGKRVRFDVRVRAIHRGKQQVRVLLANGKSLAARDVILTAPPSVWDRIEFRPALPVKLYPTVPQMGQNDKFLVVVRRQNHRRRRTAPDWITDGPIGMTWDSTEGQPGPNMVLTSFSGGSEARRFSDLPAQDRKELRLSLMETAYPISRNRVVKTLYFDWLKDPLTKGSYSFPNCGQVTTQGPLLHRGIGRRLHFAGEHTCYAFVGYMEGALRSGIDVARKIAVRDRIIPRYPNPSGIWLRS